MINERMNLMEFINGVFIQCFNSELSRRNERFEVSCLCDRMRFAYQISIIKILFLLFPVVRLILP